MIEFPSWARAALMAVLVMTAGTGRVLCADDAMEAFPSELKPPAPIRAQASPEIIEPERAGPIAAPIAVPIVVDEPGFPFVPYMLGDFIGPLANPMTDLKVSEGESPIPIDRVFYRFNAYGNLDPSRYQSLTEPFKQVNLYTNVFGFEKTGFGDVFSFGVRMPFNGIQALSRGTYLRRVPGPGNNVVKVPAGPDYQSFQFGNINTIFKLRLIEDRQAAYLVSGGMALSFPTATSQRINPGPSTAAVVQPFLGYVYSGDRLFAQGFTSFTMPVVTVQSMLLFTDLGAGYWIYRNRNPGALLTGIAPTFEMHLNAPLQGPERFSNLIERVGFLPFTTQFNLTFGGTFQFGRKSTLGLAFVLPTVGPLPFEYEFLAHFNLRF